MTGKLSEAEILRAISVARETFNRERSDRFQQFGLGEDCAYPASQVFHEYSTLGPAWVPPLDVEAAAQLTRDLAYKQYEGAPRIGLAPALNVALPLDATLAGRRSQWEFGTTPLTFAELSTLLTRGAGPTDNSQVPHRAAPSGGALYPIELYVLAFNVTGLAPAIYHYVPLDEALERIGNVSADQRRALSTFLPPGLVAGRPQVLIALSARFARTQAKYGERGYRFALLEAGHIAQNLLLLATAMGIGALPVGGFWDDPFNHVLGIDGAGEAAIYGVLLGHSE